MSGNDLKPKILKNQLFFKAVDYLIEKKYVYNQKELSAKIGVSETTLSNLKNDKKIVSDKTIYKLMDAFPGIFNIAYFRGENIYMTLKEAMEANIYADEQKKKEPSASSQAIDYTFLIEKAVEKATAYADKYIATLEKQVADKDREIERLEKEQDAKDDEIKRLQAIIHELEAENSFIIKNDPLKDYPYPVGTAEPVIEKDPVRV